MKQYNERKQIKYVVITPAFNEANTISKTIDSMNSQLKKPVRWLIVDDGSSDDTWNIIKHAEESSTFIQGIRIDPVNKTANSGLFEASEAKAFLKGLEQLRKEKIPYDFIVKLDADLEFKSDYFKILMEEAENNSKLGIVGGKIWEKKGTSFVKEKVADDHVRGATKCYRAACYNQIGGILPFLGWDVVDEMIARENRWEVLSFEKAWLLHLRPTGSRGGRFTGWSRNGFMAYYIGIKPLYICMRSLYWFLQLDFIKGFGLLHGYFRHFFSGTSKFPDESIRDIVRKNNRLFKK